MELESKHNLSFVEVLIPSFCSHKSNNNQNIYSGRVQILSRGQMLLSQVISSLNCGEKSRHLLYCPPY
jgi:hypothetical protein